MLSTYSFMDVLSIRTHQTISNIFHEAQCDMTCILWGALSTQFMLCYNNCFVKLKIHNFFTIIIVLHLLLLSIHVTSTAALGFGQQCTRFLFTKEIAFHYAYFIIHTFIMHTYIYVQIFICLDNIICTLSKPFHNITKTLNTLVILVATRLCDNN